MKFVSKDLAIKLKNKGFDRPCFGYYLIEDKYELEPHRLWMNITHRGGVETCLKRSGKDCIDAPTIDQVLEWLREDCGLYISMSCSRNYDIDADGRILGSWVYWWYEIYAHLSADLIYQEEEKEFETYDEATLAGINFIVEHLI